MSTLSGNIGLIRRSWGGSQVSAIDFADVMSDASDAASSFEAFADHIGWAKETCQNYRNGTSTPTIARLLDTIRDGRMPEPLHRAILQLLADGRYVIASLETDPDAPTQADGLMRLALQVVKNDLVIVDQVSEATASGPLATDLEKRIDESRDQTVNMLKRLKKGIRGFWQSPARRREGGRR